MNHRQTDDSESRFAGYVEGLASVIGHKDREGPLRDYCTGLLMPCERKSVEPMAAITAPHRTAAQHQSLLAGVTPTQVSVADHHLARRNRRAALFALCSPARSPGASRRETHRTAPGGMAADRVARGREGADQILALDLAGRHRICGACGYCQIALAHRTRLSGTQAGGRARTFRRPRMARLPPPRHHVHRDLRLLGLRAGDDSPLRTSFRQAVRRTCRSRRLPTPRRRRCAPSATFQIRSPPCDAD